jgi:peptide/nickel transport system substrate-binding protein
VVDRFGRRSLLGAGAAVGAGFLLGAGLDAGVAGAVRTNGPGRNGISRARPRSGGALSIGVNAEEQGFNPTTARFDTTGFMYGRTVFDPLMMVTADGGVAPYLAESVTPNADYTTWTITVRPGVKFHDGTDCDGAALLANVDAQYKSLLTGVALRPLIASYSQSGPRSVSIEMKHAWVTFPYTLAEQQICFTAAPSMLDAPEGGTAQPVGTGPFRFEDWVPNSHFTAVRNPNYWRPDLPYLDSVTFRPLPDGAARAEALQSGTVDMIHLSEPQQIVEFRGNRSYAYVDNSGKMVGSPSTNCAMLNTSVFPFDDRDARLAMAKAVNRVQYAKVIDLDVNAPSTGIYQPGSPYYTKTSYPSYDPAGARALVKKVEQKNRRPFAFTFNAVAAPYTYRVAEYVQQQLQAVGMKVTVNSIEQNELINDALAGTFEATEWSQFGGMSPDLNYVWFSTTTVNDHGISINMARNSDPRIEKALLTGMESAEAATRVKAFQAVNEYLAQDLPYIWTDRATWALVSTPGVQNWNNPTTPAGKPALGNDQGVWWLTQTWLS